MSAALQQPGNPWEAVHHEPIAPPQPPPQPDGQTVDLVHGAVAAAHMAQMAMEETRQAAQQGIEHMQALAAATQQAADQAQAITAGVDQQSQHAMVAAQMATDAVTMISQHMDTQQQLVAHVGQIAAHVAQVVEMVGMMACQMTEALKAPRHITVERKNGELTGATSEVAAEQGDAQ